jgi:hypothetical protein
MWIQQGMYEAETARLREELGAVKTRDSQALGQALAPGEAEPEPQAAALEAEIESNRQRATALLGAITEEQRRVSALIMRHQNSWADDVQRHLADKAAAYRVAILELERAREALVRSAAWELAEHVPGNGWPAGDVPAARAPDEQVGGPVFNAVRGRPAATRSSCPCVARCSPRKRPCARARAQAIRSAARRRRRKRPPAVVRGRHACGLACQRLGEPSQVRKS